MTITIRLRNGTLIDVEDAQPLTIAGISGFACHRTLGRAFTFTEPPAFTITHVESGLALIQNEPTQATALLNAWKRVVSAAQAKAVNPRALLEQSITKALEYESAL